MLLCRSQVIGDGINGLSAYGQPGPAITADTGAGRRLSVMKHAHYRIRAVGAWHRAQIGFTLRSNHIIYRGKGNSRLRILRGDVYKRQS